MELADVAIYIGRSVAILAKKLRRKKSSNKTSKYKQLLNERQGKKNKLPRFLRYAANCQPICGDFINPFCKQTKFTDDKVNCTKGDVSKCTLYKTADIECELTQETLSLNKSSTCKLKMVDDESERADDRLCITENEEIIAEITEYSHTQADIGFVVSRYTSQYSYEEEHFQDFIAGDMRVTSGGNSMSSDLGTREPGDGSDTPSQPHAIHTCPRRLLCDNNLVDDLTYKRRRTSVSRSMGLRFEEPAVLRRQLRRKDTPIFKPMHTRPTGSTNKNSDDMFGRRITGRNSSHRGSEAVRRYPSLNTAFMQSDTCSLERSLRFLGADDTPLGRSQDIELTVTSSDEESNVFEQAFVKYGFV